MADADDAAKLRAELDEAKAEIAEFVGALEELVDAIFGNGHDSIVIRISARRADRLLQKHRDRARLGRA